MIRQLQASHNFKQLIFQDINNSAIWCKFGGETKIDKCIISGIKLSHLETKNNLSQKQVQKLSIRTEVKVVFKSEGLKRKNNSPKHKRAH